MHPMHRFLASTRPGCWAATGAALAPSIVDALPPGDGIDSPAWLTATQAAVYFRSPLSPLPDRLVAQQAGRAAFAQAQADGCPHAACLDAALRTAAAPPTTEVATLPFPTPAPLCPMSSLDKGERRRVLQDAPPPDGLGPHDFMVLAGADWEPLTGDDLAWAALLPTAADKPGAPPLTRLFVPGEAEPAEPELRLHSVQRMAHLHSAAPGLAPDLVGCGPHGPLEIQAPHQSVLLTAAMQRGFASTRWVPATALGEAGLMPWPGEDPVVCTGSDALRCVPLPALPDPVRAVLLQRAPQWVRDTPRPMVLLPDFRWYRAVSGPKGLHVAADFFQAREVWLSAALRKTLEVSAAVECFAATVAAVPEHTVAAALQERRWYFNVEQLLPAAPADATVAVEATPTPTDVETHAAEPAAS